MIGDDILNCEKCKHSGVCKYKEMYQMAYEELFEVLGKSFNDIFKVKLECDYYYCVELFYNTPPYVNVKRNINTTKTTPYDDSGGISCNKVTYSDKSYGVTT